MRRLSLSGKTTGGLTLAACVIGIILWSGRNRAEGETDPKLSPILKMERKRDTAALSAATHDPDPAVAVRAIQALSALAAPAKDKSPAIDPAIARDAIRPTFADPRPAVRTSAARAWGAVGAPADVNELRTILTSDDSAQARRAAANALGQLRAWDGVGELVTAMDDPDLTVRQCAFTGVYRMTGAKFQYDPQDRPDVRRATVAAIQKMIPNMKPAHDDFMRRYRKD